jgi:pimeloyl-ACP methyl ester carboxylesterase
VTLDTHILDVTHLLFYEDLTNVYLVGKSYAGMVITGVADRAPERIGHLVYLDSPVPAHGQALADILGPETMAFFVNIAREEGDGWRVPASVTGSADSRLTPMPLQAGLQPLHLTQSLPLRIRRTYICCTTDKSPDELQAIRAHYQQAPDWHYVELASDHEPEQTVPNELAARFHALVQI